MNESIKINRGGWATVVMAHDVQAVTHRAQIVSPFAVHRNRGSVYAWSVSHLRTGLKVRYFPSYRLAQKAAAALRSLYRDVDLDTSDPREVQRLMVEKRDALVATVRAHESMRPDGKFWHQNPSAYKQASGYEAA